MMSESRWVQKGGRSLLLSLSPVRGGKGETAPSRTRERETAASPPHASGTLSLDSLIALHRDFGSPRRHRVHRSKQALLPLDERSR